MSFKETLMKMAKDNYDYENSENESIEHIQKASKIEDVPKGSDVKLLENSGEIKGKRIYGVVIKKDNNLAVQWSEEIKEYTFESLQVKEKELPFDIEEGDVLSVVVTSIDKNIASENVELILSYTNHTKKESAKLKRDNFPKNKFIAIMRLIFRACSRSKRYYGSSVVTAPLFLMGLFVLIYILAPLYTDGGGNYFVNMYNTMVELMIDGVENNNEKMVGYLHLFLFILFPFLGFWVVSNAIKETKGFKELLKILEKNESNDLFYEKMGKEK